MEDEFVKRIITGRSTTPPAHIEQAFCSLFETASNIDWYDVNDCSFEAIFYVDNREHIARFDYSGTLLSTKINLDISELPQKLVKLFESEREIMNAVGIYKEGVLRKYEVISRDKDLHRYLAMVGSDFKIVKETLL